MGFGKTKNPWLGKTVAIDGKKFSIIRLLAENNSTYVFLTRCKREQVALKRIVLADSAELSRVYKEIDILKAAADAGCDNIVKYVASSVNKLKKSETEIWIAMEYCSGGNLVDMVNDIKRKYLPEKEVLYIMLDICKAATFLHSMNPPVVHRNLKIENVLLTSEGTYKVCGLRYATTWFGVPKNSSDITKLEEEIGHDSNFAFFAPEMIKLCPGTSISTAADVWAIGSMFYRICFLKDPFEKRSQIFNMELPSFPEDSSFSTELHDLIVSLWRLDPADRPTSPLLLNSVLEEYNKIAGVEKRKSFVNPSTGVVTYQKLRHLSDFTVASFPVEKEDTPTNVSAVRSRSTSFDSSLTSFKRPNPSMLTCFNSDLIEEDACDEEKMESKIDIEASSGDVLSIKADSQFFSDSFNFMDGMDSSAIDDVLVGDAEKMEDAMDLTLDDTTLFPSTTKTTDQVESTSSEVSSVPSSVPPAERKQDEVLPKNIKKNNDALLKIDPSVDVVVRCRSVSNSSQESKLKTAEDSKFFQGANVSVENLFSLTQFDIHPSSLCHGQVNMQTIRHINVHEKGPTIVSVDIDKITCSRHEMKADDGLLHSDGLLAMRWGDHIEIVDTNQQSLRVASCVFREKVLHWQWAGSNEIALVSENSVFHWTIERGQIPIKMFERALVLGGSKVVDYQCCGGWMGLVTLTSPRGGTGATKGRVQLYCEAKSKTKVVEGEALCFRRVTFGGSLVAGVACRAKGSLFILSIEESSSSTPGPRARMPLPKEMMDNPTEIPMRLAMPGNSMRALMITNFGNVYVMDYGPAAMAKEKGEPFDDAGVSLIERVESMLPPDSFIITGITASVGGNTNSIIGVATSGHVVRVSLCTTTSKLNTNLKKVQTRSHRDSLSQRIIANDLNLIDERASKTIASSPARSKSKKRTVEDDIAEFDKHIAGKMYQEAARVAYESSFSSIRESHALTALSALSTQGPLLQYFVAILGSSSSDPLLRNESVTLTKLLLKQKRSRLLSALAHENRLDSPAALAKLISECLESKASEYDPEETAVLIPLIAFLLVIGNQFNLDSPEWLRLHECNFRTADINFITSVVADAKPATAVTFMKRYVLSEALPHSTVMSVTGIFLAVNKPMGPLVNEALDILLFTIRSQPQKDTSRLQTAVFQAVLGRHLLDASLVKKKVIQLLNEPDLNGYDTITVVELCVNVDLIDVALPVLINRLGSTLQGRQRTGDILVAHIDKLTANQVADFLTHSRGDYTLIMHCLKAIWVRVVLAEDDAASNRRLKSFYSLFTRLYNLRLVNVVDTIATLDSLPLGSVEMPTRIGLYSFFLGLPEPSILSIDKKSQHRSLSADSIFDKNTRELIERLYLSLVAASNRFDMLMNYVNHVINSGDELSKHALRAYIGAAIRLGLEESVLVICSDNANFEPIILRECLMCTSALPDSSSAMCTENATMPTLVLALMVLCERFSMLPELTSFLFHHDAIHLVEEYVLAVSPRHSQALLSPVVSTLLALDADVGIIRDCLVRMKGHFPAATIEKETVIVNKYAESIKRKPFEEERFDISLSIMRGNIQIHTATLWLIRRKSADLWRLAAPSIASVLNDGIVCLQFSSVDQLEAIIEGITDLMPDAIMLFLKSILERNFKFYESSEVGTLLLTTAIKIDTEDLLDMINASEYFYNTNAVVVAAQKAHSWKAAVEARLRDGQRYAAVNELIEAVNENPSEAIVLLTLALDICEKSTYCVDAVLTLDSYSAYDIRKRGSWRMDTDETSKSDFAAVAKCALKQLQHMMEKKL